jgi:hypothetical protein
MEFDRLLLLIVVLAILAGMIVFIIRENISYRRWRRSLTDAERTADDKDGEMQIW